MQSDVAYITYNTATCDLPDVYARALGPAALGLGHIYKVNPSWPCYNYYIYMCVCVYIMCIYIYIYIYIYIS